jgi:arginyl-tRNA synthetase
MSLTDCSINGYDFNLDAMTSFEGDTGPYLQYAHARLCSIVRKSGLNVEELDSANLDLLTEPHAVDLVRLLATWPDVLLNTTKTLEPTTILTYLFRMTHILSSSYDVLKVVGSEPELKKARMALYEAARQVLHNGMRVLGLSPVQRYVITLNLETKPVLTFCPFLQHVNGAMKENIDIKMKTSYY